MSLTKMLFWKSRETQSSPAETPDLTVASDSRSRAKDGHASSSNVIPLSTGFSGPEAMAGPTLDDAVTKQPSAAPRFTGLMNAPELTAFFGENYLGYGRYAGSRYRSRSAQDAGLQELIAKFQNTLVDLTERRQAKHDKIQREILNVEGLSESIGAQLRLACAHLEREMSVLRQQVELAEQRKGWVLEAINRYQVGFDRGVREAVDFELLGA